MKRTKFLFNAMTNVWFFLAEYMPNKYGLSTDSFYKKRSTALKQKGTYKGEVLCFKNKDNEIHSFYQWNGVKWENTTRKQITFPFKQFTRTK